LNKKLFLLIFSSVALFAQTTMCYKEGVASMSGIEDMKLDGGKCDGQKSLNEMKDSGWSVDDINISKGDSGMNYIYILKNEQQYNASDIEQIEEKIVQRLEKKKIEDEKKRIAEIKQRMSREGKELYVTKCQSCHGEKAELNALGTSKPLVTLSLSDMILAINEFRRNERVSGNGLIMTPYAKTIVERDIKNIYSYISTFKPKKEEDK